MAEHDPVEFVNSLGEKLATRSRHVCTFLGAGAATACGLSDMDGLKNAICRELNGNDRDAFERQLEDGNLEDALSRIRKIADLVKDGQTLDGMSAEDASNLDKIICQEIVGALDAGESDIDSMLKFAIWTNRADYRKPVEVFTTNYDLLLETAFERMGVPYFDGFVGNINARFQPQLVERTRESEGNEISSSFVRLWKVHGSVNWTWKDGDIVRTGRPVKNEEVAAIYPSDNKYDESRRVPFLVLQDRFRRALHEDETLVIISGYSFGDQHLNEMIFNAATRCKRSEFVAFCYSNIPDELAEKAERISNLQVAGPHEAIVGGDRGDWKEPKDSSPNVWKDGKFALRDFRHLATYLARSAPSEMAGRSEIITEKIESLLDSSGEVNDD